MSDGALVVGKPWRIRVRLMSGASPVDLTDDERVVTCSARYQDGDTEFEPTVSVVGDTDEGRVDVVGTGTELTQEGILAFEFTIGGSPVINPNTRPLLLPVRNLYEDPPL